MASRSSALLRCLSRPGPSRLASRQLPCQVCLREASTSESAGSQAVESDSVAHAADDVGSAAPVAQAAPSAPSERRPASVDGYDSWLRSVGIKYRDPPNNGPNWLGGEVPYPTNPSFRPPAPISDSVKERIYQIYFHSSPGASSASKPATPPPTIAQISEAFSISKKRVEAILRLKLLEKEWEHKDKPLQIPFQEQMERYLGARQVKNSKVSDVTFSKQEREHRSMHPSANLELEEERVHEQQSAAGNGASAARGEQDNTAFTGRDTLIRDPRMERAVWEFRAEEDGSYETTKPGAAQALDVPYNRVHSAKEAAEREQAVKERREARALKAKAYEQDDLGARIVSRPVQRREVQGGSKSYAFQSVKTPAEAIDAFSSENMGKRQFETGKRDRKQKRKERVEKAMERVRVEHERKLQQEKER